MLSAGAEMLLRMVGWSFLPDMGARMLLQFYRQLSVTLPPKFGFKASVPPPEGSPEHMKQKRISFSVVIFLYLLYTTAQSYTQAPPNFYALLDVSPAVDEPTLKTAFRNYARFNHPDRVGASGEARFIAARDAFDTLKSSTKRWAYDRFGPEVIGWEKECTSLGDYIERGLMASCGFYLVSAVAMVLYAIFGQSGFGAFWRYNIFFTLIALELLLILSPPFSILTTLFPGRVAYQHIKFLHQLFISLSIAITRIGPTILPSFSGSANTQSEWEQERTALYTVVQQVSAVAARLDREISRMIWRELKAAHGEEEPAALDESTVNEISLNSPTRRVPAASTSALPPPGAPAGATTASSAAAGLGGIELKDNLMRKLSQEVEDIVVEKNLKRHPMLARIWAEGVEAGRKAYLKEREERLRATFASQTTAVDLSQRLNGISEYPAKGSGDQEDWKKDYMSRRARSEEHSPSPSPSPSLRGGFASQPIALRNTPPPSELRNFGTGPGRRRESSPTPITAPLALRPTLGNRPSLERKSTIELAKMAGASEVERLKRGSALERLSSFSPRASFSPGPTLEGNATGATSYVGNRLSAGSLDSPGAGERFDSLGPISVRSRSMSLVG